MDSSKAITVIHEFVRERLGSRLKDIRSFDFNSLRDSGKFGCPGRCFDPADTEIMRAVYEILWGDQLPELSMENIGERMKYRGNMMNTFPLLSGAGFEKRHVSSEFREHVQRFFRDLSGQLGNFVVLPNLPAGGTTLSLYRRHRHVLNRREPMAERFDRFLIEMYQAFQKNFADKKICELIEANAFAFNRFPGEHGFYCLMHLLLLNGYGREGIWRPWEIFPPLEETDELSDFVSAAERSLEYAERLIRARSEEMYVLLKAKLASGGEFAEEDDREEEAASSVAYGQVVQAELTLIRNGLVPFTRALFRREHLRTSLPELIREGWITPAELELAGEARLSGAEWVAVFAELPPGGPWERHCDFSRFSGEEVETLLSWQPGYFDHCPTEKLSQREIDSVLRHRPELVKKFRIPDPVGLFLKTASPLREMKVLHPGQPQLPLLPDEAPDEGVSAMLRELFPEMSSEELIVWEDHIRYNEKTLLGVYSRSVALEKLEAGMRKLGGEAHSFEIDAEYRWENRLLPPLHGRVWEICAGCKYFSLHGRLGKCGKIFGHLGGVILLSGWDVDREIVVRHSQCPWNGFYFRFESALLLAAEQFGEKADTIHQKYVGKLLFREIREAVDVGNFKKALDYCAGLRTTFREYERKHPMVSHLLNYYQVNGNLVSKVRFLLAEGVVIPPDCREALLQLPEYEDSPGCRAELLTLLGEK